MDPTVQRAVDAWLADPVIDENNKREIRDLKQAGDEKQLTDRFYRELEFGTAGLRGVIGAGLNRMNVYTLGAAAQGLANYIVKQGQAAKDAGLAIACDCRRMSDAFARRTACVMAGNGIRAYLFESLRPTPELSFAVRHLHCTSGVVITASHNPPEYNGFKVYWEGGVQVVPPHDENIIGEVRAVGGFANIKAMDFDEAASKGLIRIIGKEIDEEFLKQVQGSCLNPALSAKQGESLKIVFTGLHGTGSTLVPEALRRRGFKRVIEVPEQAAPDGEFPTVESPNPEESAALVMAVDLAKREGADIAIGTDPDADRVGIAVRGPTGDFVLMTGNQTGALLTHYICEQLSKADKLPANAVMITTIVSGDLMKEVARGYGAEVIETLTGFKWIGEQVNNFEAVAKVGKPSRTYIFGAEESYGYMPATYVRDKDAVTTSAYIADMAAAAAAEGRTLYQVLESLFQKFGYFQEGTRSLTLPGKEGAAMIKAMMNELRDAPPKQIGGYDVATCADMMTGKVRDVTSGEQVSKYDLPPADVVLFTLKDGSKVIARPSGTEPKIKFYILVREPGSDLAAARTAANEKVKRIIDDVVKRAEA